MVVSLDPRVTRSGHAIDLRSYTGHRCHPNPTGLSHRGIYQSRKLRRRIGLQKNRHIWRTWSWTHPWKMRRRQTEEREWRAKINLAPEYGGPCRKTSGVNEWRRGSNSLILFFVERRDGRKSYCRMYVTRMPKGAKEKWKRSGTVSNMRTKANLQHSRIFRHALANWLTGASRGQSPTSSNKSLF